MPATGAGMTGSEWCQGEDHPDRRKTGLISTSAIACAALMVRTSLPIGPDDLDADRHAVRPVIGRNGDAGHVHQGPDPVERRA